MYRNRIIGGAFALALVLPLSAWAQEVEPSLKACRDETDDARRLACYDRAMDRAPVETNAAVETNAPVATKEVSPEERFGRSGALAREEIDRKDEESRELGELTATVTEIWTRSDGLMVLTLDNGQVWSMNRPDPFFRIKTGDKVRIQPAALGSFLLSGPSKRSTRVSRTK
jgi:hypothetical protein